MSNEENPENPENPENTANAESAGGAESRRRVQQDGEAEQLRKELPAELPDEVPATKADTVKAEAEREPAPEPEAVEPEPVEARRGEADAGEPELTGRQRLVKGLWPPRASRAQLIMAVLLFVLGLGLAIQVRSTSDNSALRGARQEDLVRILDELDDRTQRLEDEKQGLVDQRTELENSSDQANEARKQTAEKQKQLGILAGTTAAQGPGITMTVTDTKGAVEADMLLDAVQELRAAGAEAIQVNDVRVVANTYLTDGSGGKGISVDGHEISRPYRFKVIGKPQDLEPALNIPGGVVQTLEKEQATVAVSRSNKIVVDALRSAQRPDYARSSSE
ncbi:DUF881 domain-containing protein [Streptomyces sp. BH104]|uniref:DUF881 domain-containing protein n=1 Tax=Streptomyces sp. BH104 TaxID=3410407 RepID=UPI003BB518AD